MIYLVRSFRISSPFWLPTIHSIHRSRIIYFTIQLYPVRMATNVHSSPSASFMDNSVSTPLSQQVDYMNSVTTLSSSAVSDTPAPSTLTAVYNDTDFLIINKPYNIRMDGDYPSTLEKLMPVVFPPPSADTHPSTTTAHPHGRNPSRLYYHHCHQLDYATSGCLLYAKSSDAAAAATMLFEERKTQKEYLALVYGHIVTVPQRPYNKGNQGIHTLPSAILRSLSSTSNTDAEMIIESYVTELKTNAASRKVGQTMEKRRKELANQNILPLRTPQVWYDTLRNYIHDEYTKNENMLTTITNRGNPPNEWLTKIKKMGYGEMKYVARTQRSTPTTTTTTNTNSKPVDDRSDVWNTNKTEVCLDKDIQTWICYDYLRTLLDTMDASIIGSTIATQMIKNIGMLTENNWASILFDLCLYLAYHDNLRYRNDRQSKRSRQDTNDGKETETDTAETTANPKKDSNTGSTETKNAAVSLAASSPLTTPIFLIDLPIGEVAADGSDFRMQIMENDGNNEKTATSAVCSRFTETGNLPLSDPPRPTHGIPRPALTLVRIVQYGYYHNQPVTKVLLTPISGRRHQLRLHMQSIGHPIVGDDTYCYPYLKKQAQLPLQDRCPNITKYEDIMVTETQRIYRMMLHSYTLRLDFPWLIDNLPNRAYKSARRWMMKRSKENGDTTSITLLPIEAQTPDPFVPMAEFMETLEWRDTMEILKGTFT